MYELITIERNDDPDLPWKVLYTSPTGEPDHYLTAGRTKAEVRRKANACLGHIRELVLTPKRKKWKCSVSY